MQLGGFLAPVQLEREKSSIKPKKEKISSKLGLEQA
jgi:hypothetical protein